MTRAAIVQGASRGLGLALARALLEDASRTHVFATARRPDESEGLVALKESDPRLRTVALDVTREEGIANAADHVREQVEEIDLLINVAGILHEPEGRGPEKRLEAIDPDWLRKTFEINAFGPLLVIKHFHPLLRHAQRAVLANVSARVGSISDNRLGGWYGYRSSKAAQNMFTRTAAIELGRRAPNLIVVAIHPGTVDTDLSRPFQRSVAKGGLFSDTQAAGQILDVLGGLSSEDSGSFLAWDGSTIPW